MRKNNFLLEICTDSVASSIDAQMAGADRIELCKNLFEGGITQPLRIIGLARQYLSIPMFTIIRPRAGDFFYDDDEFHQMKKDITVCKNLKVDGVVFGILNIDLSVDIKRNKELVEHAKPMCSTFHRAFDETINAEQALEDIISCGFQRILTSGHQATAEKGADEISKLISLAGNRIIIMPGGDVRSSNIDFLLQKTGAKEFHSSARIDMEINESEIVRMKAYISH